jgi:hypothetical protein
MAVLRLQLSDPSRSHIHHAAEDSHCSGTLIHAEGEDTTNGRIISLSSCSTIWQW